MLRRYQIFLIENKYLLIKKNPDNTYDEKVYQAALGSVKRYLNRRGFKRGKRSGSYKINEEHIAQRNEYLRTLINNRSLPRSDRLREIYTDE